MPPFTLPALETSIGKRVALPAYEIRSISAEIYNRYDAGGPAGATWHPQRIAVTEDSQVSYELCRGGWFGGVYSSQNEAQVQSLAEALNELERHGSNATSKG